MHGNGGTGKNSSGMGVEIYENVMEGGERTGMIAGIRGGKALVYNNAVKTTSTSTAWVAVREEYDDSLNPPAISPLNGQPQHVSDTYFWGNNQNGEIIYSTVLQETIDYGGKVGVTPRNNVHYWHQEPDFDGSSGIGVGTLSNRPSVGQTGVAYWATDTQILYRWRNNAWEEYYTPYAYPHPLRKSF
jgi:hypothetical protein